MTDDLRYPIGKFARATVTPAERAVLIQQIAEAPARLAGAVAGLTDAQLDTPYRDGGWTVRQVVHHVPDSHLNAYIRCKLAITEVEPPFKTYEEARWAELPDVGAVSPALSLILLETLHARWVALLQSLSEAEFARAGRHPQWGAMTVSDLVQMYAWHGRHHVAHITGLRARMRW
jgi:DinB superfamily